MVTADITGIGWVTSAGMGCGRDHWRFAMTRGPLPEIKPTDVFDDPYPSFRRLDGYSRLGVAAIAFALQDAGLAEWTEKRNIGVIASTVYGSLGTDIDFYDTVMPNSELSPSPALFSYTLPNSFLGEAAVRFGLTGAGFVINEQHPAGRVSLQTALDHLAGGNPPKILAGVCDLDCPQPFVGQSGVPPGALFFMIEKRPSNGPITYGKLALNKKGDLQFNGSTIQDLYDLVQKCLAGKRHASRA
jgi:3-oxoacyl-[acyl-carrier-protein] synthase II